ncbi:MAG: excisionase family DNA-binding protein [Janthinobacterium lividum]
MPSTLSQVLEPTRQDIQQAREAASALSAGHLDVSELPDIVRQLFLRILNELANGQAISIVPVEPDLTTSQAARFLNVSRPYFSRLLGEGKLPFHLVGTHKRVRLRDLSAYRERQDEDSSAALAELQAQAQELNMGY